jgi:hypothetical protein
MSASRYAGSSKELVLVPACKVGESLLQCGVHADCGSWSRIDARSVSSTAAAHLVDREIHEAALRAVVIAVVLPLAQLLGTSEVT